MDVAPPHTQRQMAFRKKNISILPSRGSQPPAPPLSTPTTFSVPPPSVSTPLITNSTVTPHPLLPPHTPGVRPSPISGHPSTSTGTPSLDALLSGHAGLPLGSSLLVEESGTTDFGGALLRYYAAEGILQGHHVIVVGVNEGWARDLPAAVVGAEAQGKFVGASVDGKKERERMKIAWRYERLAAGGFGAGSVKEVGSPRTNMQPQAQILQEVHGKGVFCHSFDLTKRLELSPTTKITFIPLPTPLCTAASPPSSTPSSTQSPFSLVLSKLLDILNTSPPGNIHRLVIPNILFPGFYPPHACLPVHLLQFTHSLRALLRTHSTTLTAMISLQLELHPRTTGLVCWIELLSDAVVELVPIPALMERAHRAASKGQEDVPMGLVRVWKVPDKRLGIAGAGGGVGDDLAFTVTRKRFGIGLFSLPPAEEVEEGGEGMGKGALGKEEMKEKQGKVKVDIEF